MPNRRRKKLKVWFILVHTLYPSSPSSGQQQSSPRPKVSAEMTKLKYGREIEILTVLNLVMKVGSLSSYQRNIRTTVQ